MRILLAVNPSRVEEPSWICRGERAWHIDRRPEKPSMVVVLRPMADAGHSRMGN